MSERLTAGERRVIELAKRMATEARLNGGWLSSGLPNDLIAAAEALPAVAAAVPDPPRSEPRG
jgi:hypothetical protein